MQKCSNYRNQNLAWRAMCELGDYFSRLGGAARPFNMAESEIHLYIGYKLLEINHAPIDGSEFVEQEFIKAAKPVVDTANDFLTEIKLSNTELIPFVLDFYEHADKKLKETDKTLRWVRFGEYLKKNNA